MSKLHIVMYHYVRELQVSRYPEIKGLEYSLFEQQLKFFKKFSCGNDGTSNCLYGKKNLYQNGQFF